MVMCVHYRSVVHPQRPVDWHFHRRFRTFSGIFVDVRALFVFWLSYVRQVFVRCSSGVRRVFVGFSSGVREVFVKCS